MAEGGEAGGGEVGRGVVEEEVEVREEIGGGVGGEVGEDGQAAVEDRLLELLLVGLERPEVFAEQDAALLNQVVPRVKLYPILEVVVVAFEAQAAPGQRFAEPFRAAAPQLPADCSIEQIFVGIGGMERPAHGALDDVIRRRSVDHAVNQVVSIDELQGVGGSHGVKLLTDSA